MSRNSTKARQICLDTHLKTDAMGEYMICHVSGVRFNPRITKWRADHIRRHAEGGEDTPSNLWPILESADAGPDGKAAQDTSEIAKGKRVRKKLYGVERKSGFRKPPPGYNSWTRRMRDEA